MTWRYEDADFEIPVEFEDEANALACYEKRIVDATKDGENHHGKLWNGTKLVCWFIVRRKL
jgi:hypothetical protein